MKKLLLIPLLCSSLFIQCAPAVFENDIATLDNNMKNRVEQLSKNMDETVKKLGTSFAIKMAGAGLTYLSFAHFLIPSIKTLWTKSRETNAVEKKMAYRKLFAGLLGLTAGALTMTYDQFGAKQ